MHATICPTITAGNAADYREQMERVAPFVRRVHIDLADGAFTHVKLVPIKDVWWPGGVHADIHIMYQEPFGHTRELLALNPQLIIVHAEGKGDFVEFAQQAHQAGVRVGVALKPETMPQVIEPALDWIDHVLIFSGHLGHFGGEANTHLLTKVLYLRNAKPGLEIGWDGGINAKNVHTLTAGGVQVLNTGGFIHHAPNPQAAYEQLEQLARAEPLRRKQVI